MKWFFLFIKNTNIGGSHRWYSFSEQRPMCQPQPTNGMGRQTFVLNSFAFKLYNFIVARLHVSAVEALIDPHSDTSASSSLSAEPRRWTSARTRINRYPYGRHSSIYRVSRWIDNEKCYPVTKSIRSQSTKCGFFHSPLNQYSFLRKIIYAGKLFHYLSLIPLASHWQIADSPEP